jgi:glycosyltransferase involved in cell wall biosynthesis
MAGNKASPAGRQASAMSRRGVRDSTATDRHPVDTSQRPALDVLFVLNNLAVGGSERKVVRLANTLQARGERVALAYLNEPDDLLSEVQVENGCLRRTGRFSFAAMARLRALVEARRPRNVVSVNLYPALYVVAATRGLANPPRTIGLMNTTQMRQGSRWRRGLYLSVLRYLQHTVYGSELQRDTWLNAGNPMRQRSQVIYNGVDLKHFNPGATAAQARQLRQRHGIDAEAFVIGTVGRLAPEKNQAALIDALARMRASGSAAYVVLVGDGPLRESLQAQAHECGVADAVIFAGTQEDVRGWLGLFDVFVLPSLTETFSNAALEAMAMQLPVVLTRTGGAAEMIEDGRQGHVLELADLPQRLPAVLEHLQADPRQRAAMAGAARQRAQDLFSWDAMVRAYQSAFTPGAA